jgi:hypothetical protein
VVARVDKQDAASPLKFAYDAVRRGSARSFSFGGFMSRVATAAGPRIRDIDITELSVTPVSAGVGTHFDVVPEGKALGDVLADFQAALDTYELGRLRAEVKGFAQDDHARWVSDAQRRLG